jgi:membrane protein DedA with SNARE-associated domain
MLDNISAWVVDIVNALGYIGVALLVVVENVFPPIPSEIILPFAGFVAGRGEASFALMVVAATIGSVVGALVLYGLSAWIGEPRLRRFVVCSGRWFGVKPSDLERAEHWFARHERSAVLFGRCVPLVRSVVSIPAGFCKMKLVPFALYTTLGSLVWNMALIGAGLVLGENWERVQVWVGAYQWVVLFGLAVAGVAVVWVLHQRRRDSAAAGSAALGD